MGSALSQEQLAEYRQVVKDRLSDDAIAFLHRRFMRAAPSGVMTPLAFRHFMDETGVYKDKRIAAQRLRNSSGSSSNAQGKSSMAARAAHLLDVRRYLPFLSPALTAGSYTGRGAAAVAATSSSGGGGAAAAAAATGGTAVRVEDDLYLHLFRSYDLDGDGVITFNEFLRYHVAILFSTEELVYIVFNAYDDDGDGLLSLCDIRTVIEAATRYVGDCDVDDVDVQRVIDAEARRLFGFLDIRKEGRVRPDDMRLIVQKHPQILEKMKYLM